METWCKRSSRKETVARRKGGQGTIRKKETLVKAARETARLSSTPFRRVRTNFWTDEFSTCANRLKRFRGFKESRDEGSDGKRSSTLVPILPLSRFSLVSRGLSRVPAYSPIPSSAWRRRILFLCQVCSAKNTYKKIKMAHQTKPKTFTVIYQAWDVVFHHQMKHREECCKYDAQRRWDVSSVDETCFECLILLLKENDFRRRN